ncbi:MAG: bifunctional phosphoglucose/phosphomannose isomerase [Candidatus Marinimicrobia bacterium]|nr:bifunctional phosphoglucose/phosphomannose isomerase [Candidatus Neomarinimicrobiota bacterium]|tara:strand:+ start:1256 stop:2296 length:1041 start_codon:yes stop_codon:yes gene_type:complete
MFKNIDKENMFHSIWSFPENIMDAIDLGDSLMLRNSYDNIQNIIVAGMGGSAIGGDIVSVLESSNIKIPFMVCRDYSLPNWVNKNTLIICSSYSGNTEETLSIFNQSLNLGAKVCGITTGGILLKKLEEFDKDYIIIPSGLQPRAAIAYSFIPIIKFLEKLCIIESDFNLWIQKTLISLKENRDLYNKEDDNNPVYRLAKNIYNKIPIIYSDNSTMRVNGIRIKGQICENAKMLAYCNDLPELNHNEIVGWKNNKNIIEFLCVIWLKDYSDNKRIKYRQKITQSILDEINIDQYSIEVKGESFQERFLHVMHYGDWLSFWCAILHHTDPSPVEKIIRLKEELGNRH